MKEKQNANESLKSKGQKRKALQPIFHRSKAARTVYEEEQTRESSDNDDKDSDCTELDVLMVFDKILSNVKNSNKYTKVQGVEKLFTQDKYYW